MNHKFAEFNTINKDNSINKTNVTAYIADKVLLENDTNDKKGKLVIVDNTNEQYPIANLLSEYGFYIDDVFISGGYGFKTFSEAKKVLDTVNGFEEIYETLENNILTLKNKTFIVSIKENPIDDTIGKKYLDAEYNKYGFIVAYKYLEAIKRETTETLQTSDGNGQVTEYENGDLIEINVGQDIIANIVEYQIYVRDKTDIEYIDEILVESDNDGLDYVEIEDMNADQKPQFKVKFTIKINNLNIFQVDYNQSLKVYVKTSTTQQPIQINTEQASIYTKELSFNIPTIGFSDDLELYIVNKFNEVVYSETFKGLLKWKDRYSYGTSSDINEYNFRNVNFEPNTLIKEFINNTFNNYSQLIEYNNEIFITFENESNEASYDYLIFRNNYNVEFYFNNIKSNNWIVKTIENYFVYQSPQKYMGSHIWKIIIKS